LVYSDVGVGSGARLVVWGNCGVCWRQPAGARGDTRLTRRRSGDAAMGDPPPALAVATAEECSPGPPGTRPPTTGNPGCSGPPRPITGYDVTNCRVRSISSAVFTLDLQRRLRLIKQLLTGFYNISATLKNFYFIRLILATILRQFFLPLLRLCYLML